jgi:hypothetical protein
MFSFSLEFSIGTDNSGGSGPLFDSVYPFGKPETPQRVEYHHEPHGNLGDAALAAFDIIST